MNREFSEDAKNKPAIPKNDLKIQFDTATPRFSHINSEKWLPILNTLKVRMPNNIDGNGVQPFHNFFKKNAKILSKQLETVLKYEYCTRNK